MDELCEFDKQLVDRGFVISKKLLFESGKGLYIDFVNKKWVLTGTNLQKLRRFDFSQIIKCELAENKKSEVSGRAGSAIVGGLIGGLPGAIIGSARKRAVNETVVSYLVRITINDIKAPVLTFSASSFEEERAHRLVALFAFMKENI